MKYCLKPYSGAADFRNRVAAIKNPDMMKNKRTPMTCMCGTYGGLAAAPTPKNARACPQQTICAARARQASSVIDVSFLVLANVNIPAPDSRNLVLQPARANPEATQSANSGQNFEQWEDATCSCFEPVIAVRIRMLGRRSNAPPLRPSKATAHPARKAVRCD